jgi:hypothetical protein
MIKITSSGDLSNWNSALRSKSNLFILLDLAAPKISKEIADPDLDRIGS